MAASEYIVSAANLQAMADAIREKTGQAGLITPNQMAAAIAAIPGGGGGVTVEPLSVTENGVYTAPAGKAFSPVTVAVPTGFVPPSGIEIGSFTVTSSSYQVTVNHSFGSVPYIAYVVAAMPNGWTDALVSSLLGASPYYGTFDINNVAAQKLDSVSKYTPIGGGGYQTTTSYTTYPAAMTENSVTFATGRYYNIKFEPGITYVYIISGKVTT